MQHSAVSKMTNNGSISKTYCSRRSRTPDYLFSKRMKRTLKTEPTAAETKVYLVLAMYVSNGFLMVLIKSTPKPMDIIDIEICKALMKSL